MYRRDKSHNLKPLLNDVPASEGRVLVIKATLLRDHLFYFYGYVDQSKFEIRIGHFQNGILSPVECSKQQHQHPWTKIRPYKKCELNPGQFAWMVEAKNTVCKGPACVDKAKPPGYFDVCIYFGGMDVTAGKPRFKLQGNYIMS